MNVSIIIPSNLRRHPDGGYWWYYAFQSIDNQTVTPAEVILAVDPDSEILAISAFGKHSIPARVVRGDVKGHQSASNVAVKSATSPIVAFLEDDDSWEPWHLEQSLAIMEREGVDLVTNSQLLVDPEGQPLRDAGVIAGGGNVFHFPTASGWVFNRLAWLKLGGFDTRFKIHHDNELLGRWNQAGLSRVHVATLTEDFDHPWLQALRCCTRFVVPYRPSHWVPSVHRTVHGEQIMAGPGERSSDEYAALKVLYGCIPW